MNIKSRRAWANSGNRVVSTGTLFKPVPELELKVEEEDKVFEDIDEVEDLSEDGGVG